MQAARVERLCASVSLCGLSQSILQRNYEMLTYFVVSLDAELVIHGFFRGRGRGIGGRDSLNCTSRSEREYPLLGSRGSRLSCDRRRDRALARRLPRRFVSEDPRARRLWPGAVRHVQRGAASHRRTTLAGLCSRWRAGRRNAHVGLSGVARYHRANPAPRRNDLAAVVRGVDQEIAT